MSARSPRDTRESGQAAVEAAVTLPLVVFLVLGTLQLFLMMQGRLMAEYAVFRATRVGSVRHGDCEAMTHAAVVALLPSFYSFLGRGGGGTPGQLLADAFAARRNNPFNQFRYVPGPDGNHDGVILWLIREGPVAASVPDEDAHFDQWDADPIRRLEMRLVYWFPLKIPFADWVISRMVLARWGWQDYSAQNPLMLTQKAQWEQTHALNVEGAIRAEVMARFAARQYVMPIQASASLRMMTPLQRRFFTTQNCAPAPEVL
ncbi:TadE/TadG family type IV pilus assembly protein [Corallococcus aberystwythensis]|uniref:Pilus assembly protein n=1 Tax=Corallococcus aberystwythensis TaxID=2316722 RepID=A0A3A8QPD4_9BACT|nr:TadE family protein [Corallococcus aberystwythensis]RKH70523.1 pilus assembly protein [Corallococcus aberystwythensis]